MCWNAVPTGSRPTTPLYMLSCFNTLRYAHVSFSELMEHVCQFIESSISVENCLTLQAVAKLYSLDSLMSKVNNCILENFSVVSQRKQFLKLSLENLQKVLLSENLTVRILKPKMNLFYSKMSRLLMFTRKHVTLYLSKICISIENSTLFFSQFLFSNKNTCS